MAEDVELYVTDLTLALQRIASPEVKKRILMLWGKAMRAYLDQRFVQNSRGKGDWAPLKETTVHRRRKPAKVSQNQEQVELQKHFQQAAILVDTGMLRASLNPNVENASGSYQKITLGEPSILEVGIGGSAPHSKKSKKRKSSSNPITVAELAVIHHFGTRTIPARPIVVPPDEATQQRLEEIATQEILR